MHTAHVFSDTFLRENIQVLPRMLLVFLVHMTMLAFSTQRLLQILDGLFAVPREAVFPFGVEGPQEKRGSI